MSNVKKKYDGKTSLLKDLLGDPSKKALFCMQLYELQGGDSKSAFETDGLGQKLEVATTTSLNGLQRLVDRISGAINGTGNKDTHTANRWVAKLATSGEETNLRKLSPPTDIGMVLATAWYESIQAGSSSKIDDNKAYKFAANAAKAVIDVSGYNPDEIIEFSQGR